MIVDRFESSERTTTVDAAIADDASGLPCHRCGYDVRAQPLDGVCPACNADVAESRRLAAIPTRPAWRDSDPRWRRRILAGLKKGVRSLLKKSPDPFLYLFLKKIPDPFFT